jgi:hypothetical protein
MRQFGLGDWLSRSVAREYALLHQGAPVPGTGGWGRKRKLNPASAGKSSGVSGNARILPHRYVDELDNGSMHRRQIRRAEARMWLAEWREEQESELREMMAYESWE